MIIELTDDELAIARIALRMWRNALIDESNDFTPSHDIQAAQKLHDRLVSDEFRLTPPPATDWSKLR